MQLLRRLNEVGFERTRRALAALALSLFICLYLMVSLNAPDGWSLAFVALAVCYLVAFMGVAAEWFWGRWFASGLGWSGVMVAVASLIMIGWTPPLAIYGGLHGIVVLALAGKKMVERYDLQDAWRQRYAMDEFGVARLRKTVTRAAASLPSMIIWALGPKEPGQSLVLTGAALLAATLATGGLFATVRMRSWGLLALASAAALVFLSPGVLTPTVGLSSSLPSALSLGPTLTAAFLAAAVAPFALPALRFLKSR